MSLHVIKGTAAPTTTPTEIGQHFLDTTNGTAYVSVDTNASTDWKRIDNAGAGVTTFLGLSDSPVNYVGSAGKVATVNPGETALTFEEGNSPLAEMSLSTSNLIGCEISINADNTLFDMAEGTGIHVDNTTTPGTPVITVVNVPERLGNTVDNIGSQPSTSISIDGSGNIIQSAAPNTPSQRRDRFSVGVLIHTSLVTIDDIAIAWVPGYDIKGQLHDLMDAIGFFITGGNIVSGVSSTLSFQKSSGTGFAPGINVDVNNKDPNGVVLPIQNPVTFFTIKQDGVVTGVSTFLDPTVYDNAGVITTVPSNNNATIKYIYLFATGAMSVLQGQEVFATFAAAVDASGGETVVVPGILGTGILMARVIMVKNATDTTDTADVRFVASTSIASGGGGGAATTMQGSYDISVQPQVTLDSSSGGIHYEDASTPIGDFLFKVSNNADTTDFIKVDVGGVTGSELISDGLNPNTAVAGDADGKLISSATTTIELGYLSGTTANVQTQIDSKEPTVTGTTSADIYQGDKTFVPKLGLPISTATQSALDAKPDNFDSLTDTPPSKTGFGFSAPFVNEAETDLEYRKVQSELTADLNLTVDFAAGAEVPGVTYLTTQAAWDYQAQFYADSAETFTVTITTINCASLTDMADMALSVLSGAWTHVTMFWPGTQVCNPAATIFTGTLYNFSNCIAPFFDGRGQSMDLDLSNRVRRTMSYAWTTARIVGANNTTDAFVIRNATFATVGGANDVAVRARNFSTVAADHLWVLGNNNRGAACDESLMSLNNAKLLGRQYGFYADATSVVAAINGPSFDDGATLVPDVGSVDVFVQSGATCNFVTANWSGLRDETNLLATVNIPMPDGVVYNNDFPNLKEILDSKVDV